MIKSTSLGAKAAASFALANWIILSGAALIRAQDCRSLSPLVKQAVTSYVQNRYGNAGAVALHIADISLIGSTCYRKITWESSSGDRKITLYLTPDGRYLTPTLMDISEDPRAASLKQEQDPMKALLAGTPPFRGPADAPVTVVEFVDFQCPDCRHFAGMMVELPEPEASNIRVVLRQHPFSFHAWARKAAAMSICVGAQDDGAFWKLSDSLFAHQDELTAENFDSRLLPFVKGDLHLDPQTIKSCIDKGGYETALLQDEGLSRQFSIRETPTVFVNGRRFAGFRSIEDLKRAIDAALAEAQKAQESSPLPPKQ